MRLPSLSRLRLFLLIGLLAGLWAYAIVTDHPAPAWGSSQLPDLLFNTVLLVGAAAVVGLPIWAVSRKRGRARSDRGERE